MYMPIVEGLIRYIEEKNIRFHMPGHKGKHINEDWIKHIPEIDVTEVNGTDNLHNPQEMILESQKLSARTFGAKKTFYSVNGTTGGLYTAIVSCTMPRDKVLVQRDCHRSVYNALIFNQLTPVYIYPKYDKKNNINVGLSPRDINDALKKHKDIKAVIITYPSYYGVCSDIKSIAKIVHKYNKILIVDEAHGSHFAFSKRLPITALKAGADITVQSIHKTLPSFTQSSMIHIGSDRVDLDRFKKVYSMYQTTSPSYILMASLDYARAYMESLGREKLNKLIDIINRYVPLFKELQGVKIFSKENLDKDSGLDFDITKILISLYNLNITGTELENILRKKYRIQLEMSDIYYGLAMASVFSEENEINELFLAIKDISKENKHILRKQVHIDIHETKPEKYLELYESFNKQTESNSLYKSLGRISGDFIIPYPPGIPLLCPGEKITKQTIYIIKSLEENGVKIIGYDKNSIKVLKM